MTTQTIAQELVKGCNKCSPSKRHPCKNCGHPKMHHRFKLDDKSCGECWGLSEDKKELRVCSEYEYTPTKVLNYCPQCKSQASIYARALNEQLEWIKEHYEHLQFITTSYSSQSNRTQERRIFIESELTLLKEAGLL